MNNTNVNSTKKKVEQPKPTTKPKDVVLVVDSVQIKQKDTNNG